MVRRTNRQIVEAVFNALSMNGVEGEVAPPKENYSSINQIADETGLDAESVMKFMDLILFIQGEFDLIEHIVDEDSKIYKLTSSQHIFRKAMGR